MNERVANHLVIFDVDGTLIHSLEAPTAELGRRAFAMLEASLRRLNF